MARIESEPVGDLDRLTHACRAFLTAAPARFLLRLTTVPAIRTAGAPREPFATFAQDNGRLTVDSDRVVGHFDYRRHEGALTQPADVDLLDSFLCAIAVDYLLQDGGLVLHAAGAADADGAIVFFGCSGSGKTTLAGRLEAAGLSVLSDEAVAIRHEPSVGWMADGLPWRGQALSKPLRGLVHLVQAPALEFEPLDGEAATRAIAPNVFFTDDGRGPQFARFLEIAEGLLAAVPCLRMHYPRDAAVWPAACRAVERR